MFDPTTYNPAIHAGYECCNGCGHPALRGSSTCGHCVRDTRTTEQKLESFLRRAIDALSAVPEHLQLPEVKEFLRRNAS